MTPSPLLHHQKTPRQESDNHGMLVLENGSLFRGQGLGARGIVIAEVCFQTAMTGYQEVITDPSYRGQIVVFTTPHIGNVGTTSKDEEFAFPSAPLCGGIVIRDAHVVSSNYRAEQSLCRWLESHNMIALTGIDTRALTHMIRREGFLRGAIIHGASRKTLPSPENVLQRVLKHPVMTGQNLSQQTHSTPSKPPSSPSKKSVPIVILDYGMKASIARLLSHAGGAITILPGTSSTEAILAEKPRGVLLSNGPGDPTAVAPSVLATITDLIAKKIPLLGICFGHQLLGLALGGKIVKMHQGHHGANHPVLEHKSGRVYITSMNHGFALDGQALPADVRETHRSLFDQSNCGIEHKAYHAGSAYVGSVQFHPEASPGPHDTRHVLTDFYRHCV